MGTSFFGDTTFVLRLLLPPVGAFIASAVFVPWLMGWKWRRKGEQPPRLARRVVTCAIIAIAALLGPLIVIGGLDVLGGGDPVEIAITLSFVAITIGCIVAAARLMRDWTKSVKAHVWLIVLVCGIASFVFFITGVGRSFTLAKRAIDGACLHTIGHELVHYHEEHGAYPDDLRRLVDFEQPADLLLSIYGTSKDKIPDPRPVPYDGPCDFIYIRLPDDAPDDLVWVWQPVKYHKNEGGNVLFKGGYVRWMKAEQLKAEVARTHKWLEAHPTTQPTTATIR